MRIIRNKLQEKNILSKFFMLILGKKLILTKIVSNNMFNFYSVSSNLLQQFVSIQALYYNSMLKLKKQVILDYLSKCSDYMSWKKQSILIMGKSKAGKSTFIAAGLKLAKLRGRYQAQPNDDSEQVYELQDPQCQKDLDIILELEDQSYGIQIGENWNSCTQIPMIYEIEQQKVVDFPGYSDSRGPQNRIVNGFFIDEILKNSGKIKVVLVAKYDEIREAMKSEDILKNVKNRFPSTYTEILSNIILVVTHATYTNVQTLRKRFQSIIKTSQLEAENFIKVFYEHFSKKENMKRIIMMPKAKLNQTYVSGENWRKIVLEETQYIPTPKFQFYFEQSAELSLREYVEEEKLNLFDTLDQFEGQIRVQLKSRSKLFSKISSENSTIIQSHNNQYPSLQNPKKEIDLQTEGLSQIQQQKTENNSIQNQFVNFSPKDLKQFQQRNDKIIHSIIQRYYWANQLVNFKEKKQVDMSMFQYLNKQINQEDDFFKKLNKFNDSSNPVSQAKLQISKQSINFLHFLTNYFKYKEDFLSLIKQKFKIICTLYHEYLKEKIYQYQLAYNAVVRECLKNLQAFKNNMGSIEQLQQLSIKLILWQKNKQEDIILNFDVFQNLDKSKSCLLLLKAFQKARKINKDNKNNDLKIDFLYETIQSQMRKIRLQVNEEIQKRKQQKRVYEQKKKQEQKKRQQQQRLQSELRRRNQQAARQRNYIQSISDSNQSSIPFTHSERISDWSQPRSIMSNQQVPQMIPQNLQAPQFFVNFHGYTNPQNDINPSNQGNNQMMNSIPTVNSRNNNSYRQSLVQRRYNGIYRLSYQGKYLSCNNGPRMSYQSMGQQYHYLSFVPVGGDNYRIKFENGGYLMVRDQPEGYRVRLRNKLSEGQPNWKIIQVRGGIQLSHSQYGGYFNGKTSVQDKDTISFYLESRPNTWVLNRN